MKRIRIILLFLLAAIFTQMLLHGCGRPSDSSGAETTDHVGSTYLTQPESFDDSAEWELMSEINSVKLYADLTSKAPDAAGQYERFMIQRGNMQNIVTERIHYIKDSIYIPEIYFTNMTGDGEIVIKNTIAMGLGYNEFLYIFNAATLERLNMEQCLTAAENGIDISWDNEAYYFDFGDLRRSIEKRKASVNLDMDISGLSVGAGLGIHYYYLIDDGFLYAVMPINVGATAPLYYGAVVIRYSIVEGDIGETFYVLTDNEYCGGEFGHVTEINSYIRE